MTENDTAALLRGLTSGDDAWNQCDLHVHSTISDGSESFLSLLQQANQNKITHIAFTNHDTTKGLDEAILLGKEYCVNVIGGVEISACNPAANKKVHILGYGLTSESPAINKLCAPLLKRRDQNSRWQLEQIIKADFNINLDLVESLASCSTSLYKQHIMAGLTVHSYDSEPYQRLYRSLFKGEGICVRDIEYLDARDAVRAIIADGGIAVLAHPGQLDSYDMVAELVEAGLQGIEKYHPYHDPDDWSRCDALASQFNLICTGGSDYHGTFGASTTLGT